MNNISDLLKKGYEMGASDFHFTVGAPPIARVHGKLVPLAAEALTGNDCRTFAASILDEEKMAHLQEVGETDCSYSLKGVSRFRVNVFKQRSALAIAMRTVNNNIPSIAELKLPPVLTELTHKQSGLILVTGPTGSGKSTTLASMMSYMNNSMNRHIITIEDPIEYLHKHKNCLINQRELGSDTLSFANALRAALREDPDVILVGEMRDTETISIALTAAETGHLVLSTLHTIGAAKTIDRIVDSFPQSQQQQTKVQLASVLNAVISQQIIPRADGSGRVAAIEVMVANVAVKNLIREGKSHQIQSVIETGGKEQMQTMDNDLIALYRHGVIDKARLYQYAADVSYIARVVGL